MIEYYWHIHHNALLEPTTNIQERIEYVRTYKPAHEIETRLRWMTPVQGAIPVAIREAGDAAVKAWADADKAWDDYQITWDDADKARDAYAKAWATSNNAWGDYFRAINAWGDCFRAITEDAPELEALHAIEHPGCPWNGKTLFPENR